MTSRASVRPRLRLPTPIRDAFRGFPLWHHGRPRLPMNSDVEIGRTIVGVPVVARIRISFIGLAALGGACGTLARVGIVQSTPVWRTISLGTVLVNLGGPLLLGVLIGALGHGTETRRRRALRLVLGVGVLGALTSYAQLAMDVVVLTEHGQLPLAVGYAAATIVAGAVAAWAGLTAGAGWSRRRIAARRTRAEHR